MENRENSKRFIDAFVQIEMVMKKMLGKHSAGFTSLVHQACKKNATINHYRLDLIEYAQLRNAITHNRSENNEVIAEPHLEVVEKIERIAKELSHPQCIVDLNLGPVFTSHPKESALTLSKIQEEKNYSIVPIYEEGRYIGLVHSKLYQSAYAKEAHDLSVHDLLFLRKDKNRVIFMAENASLRELLDVYFKMLSQGKGIIGVIVSENGFMNEPARSILTPADLPKIFELLE